MGRKVGGALSLFRRVKKEKARLTVVSNSPS
jgi:hypothetical protein